MQRCLDRHSPENESLFFPSSLAKPPWQESAADSLGLDGGSPPFGFGIGHTEGP